MTKNFTDLTDTYAQHVVDFNDLVNKVGDLTNLNTSEDSDLVGAINAVLTEGGVDSAAIVSLLDSGQYIKYGDLSNIDSASDFVTRRTAQTIVGKKTFTQQATFSAGAKISASTPEFKLDDITRSDNGKIFSIAHTDSSTSFKWKDSNSPTATQRIIKLDRDLGNAEVVGSIKFYTNNTLVGVIDSASHIVANSLLTRTKADTRYLLDSNTVGSGNIQASAVGESELGDSSVSTAKIQQNSITTVKLVDSSISTAKLQNDAVTATKLASVVTLIIYDSTGTPVKTLYGAGA